MRFSKRVPIATVRSSLGRSAALVAAAAFGLASPTFGAINLFLNGSNTGTWEDGGNWSGGAVPTTGDDAYIDSGFTVSVSTAGNTAAEMQVGVGPNAYGNRGNPGGTGTLNILSGGEITTNGNLVVGQSQEPTVDSSGTINIETGGSLTIKGGNSLVGFFGNNDAGFDFPTTGTINVNGGSFNWAGNDPRSTLWLGGNSDTNRVGKGVFNLNSGTASGGAVRVGDYGTGTLNINGGTFSSRFFMSIGLGNNPNSGHGEVNVSGGTLNLAEISINENKIEDCFVNQTGGTVTVGYIGTEALYSARIGRSDKGRGLYNISAGQLNVAGTDLWVEGHKEGVLNVSGTAQVNVNSIAVENTASDYGLAMGGWSNGIATVNQTGGSVVVQPTSLLGLYYKPADGGTSTYNLSGGTLTLGDITPAGGTQAKVFNFDGGTLIANDNMTVPNANFTGGLGNLQTNITANGAKIDTAGFNVTWTSAVNGDGALNKNGAGSLALVSNNGYTGGTIVNAGALLANNLLGSATGSGTVTVAAAGTLGGNGGIAGATTVNGHLAPGADAASTGTLTFVSTLSTSAAATTDVQLASSSDYDKIAVIGNATIGGTLALTTNGTYVPAFGQTHRILTGAAVGGHFAAVTGNQLAANKWLAVTYGSTGVNVTAALPGDADLSTKVEFADLLTLAKNYNQSDRVWAQGDFDGSGTVGFEDLLALAKNYNQSNPADVAVPASIAADWALAQSLVPEPTTLATLIAPLTFAAARRRRPQA